MVTMKADSSTGKDPNSYNAKPYSSEMLDTPLVHMILEPCLPLLHPLLACIYSFRWMLIRPLQIRLLPAWFPRIPIPGLKFIPYVTLGDILLLSPLVVILYLTISSCFGDEATDASGKYSTYAVYFTFLTANKTNSVFAFLSGIPFERMVPYHMLGAFVAVTTGFVHALVAYRTGGSGDSADQDERHRYLSGDSPYSLVGSDPNIIKYFFDGPAKSSGSIWILCMLGLVGLSIFPFIRRIMFNVWLYLHILLAVGTIACAVIHDGKIILVFAAWWGVDLVVRYAVMAKYRYPQQASLRQIGTNVVEISFAKSPGFQYNPGQFVQLAIPQVSYLEYHPMSMSSAPHEDTVTFHLRASGNWTKKVYELAGETPTTDIRMEGPYGSLAVDLEYPYDTVLLVAGGIGATNCLSVGKHLLHKHPDSLKKIHFVWSARDYDLVREMPQLGMTSEFISTDETFESLSQEDAVKVTTDSNEEHEGPEPVVQTDIYITQKSKDQEDPTKIPGLRGRPNLKEIVHGTLLKTTCRRVALFGCGPRGMMEDLREACRKQSTCGKPTIDLHLKTFAL